MQIAFQMKAALIDFLGDEERFPYHFLYKRGDFFVYDGEEFQGGVCAGLLGSIGPALPQSVTPVL